MTESELFPQYREYSQAQQRKITLFTVTLLLFTWEIFINHMKVNAKYLPLFQLLTMYVDAWS